jgi:hypothetical protein
MMVEVERRNQEELTEQDKSKNLCWKLVGRRGQKRMVKVAEREAVSRRGGEEEQQEEEQQRPG